MDDRVQADQPSRSLRPRDAAGADIDRDLGQRIRLLREARRLPLADIALRMGKSVGFISQVERGLSSLSVREAMRIADVLGVDFTALVAPAGPAGRPSPIRRAGETAEVTFHPSGITKLPLSPDNAGAVRLYVMSLLPGASTGPDLYWHEGEEAGVVTGGEILLTIEGERHSLREGDSFRFASTLPHGFSNPGSGPATALWVNVR